MPCQFVHSQCVYNQFCDMKVKCNYLLLNGFADPVETTEKPIQECCACGTAKYRVTFYGNWSEKVHPKDYPSKNIGDVLYYHKTLLGPTRIVPGTDIKNTVPYPVLHYGI